MNTKNDNNSDHIEFIELHNRVTDLFFHLTFYKTLFANPSTHELMRQQAPKSFRMIQNAMDYDIVRRVCAITDPADAPKNRQNLSIVRFKGVLDSCENQIVRQRGIELIDSIRDKKEKVKSFRDRVLMHHDLDTALSADKELSRLEWSVLNELIDIVAELTNCIGTALNNRPRSTYESAIVPEANHIPLILHGNDRMKKLNQIAHNSIASDAMVRELCKCLGSYLDDEIFRRHGYRQE